MEVKVRKIKHYTTKVYEWDFNKLGLFRTTFIDGKLSDLRFCEHGSGIESGLYATNTKFLRAIHQALSELIEMKLI